MTPQSGNQVSTSLGNSGLCLTVFARNRDTAVPAEGNGDLQTLICVLVARPRRCLTLSNPVPWQNWKAAYLGYTLWMKTLFHGWPIMVNDTHTRRRMKNHPMSMKFDTQQHIWNSSTVVTKYEKFQNSRWRVATILKIVFGHTEQSSNCHEILHGEVVSLRILAMEQISSFYRTYFLFIVCFRLIFLFDFV